LNRLAHKLADILLNVVWKKPEILGFLSVDTQGFLKSVGILRDQNLMG
jgi:hypothetical protein